MFSWSKKKDSKRRERPNRSEEENEFGIKLDKGPSDKQLEAELKALAGVDNLPEDNFNLNDGEEDEEAELLRLIGGGGKGKRPPKKTTKNPDEALGDLGDISADIQDIGDEDVEVDENDEELLGELLELTQPEETVEDEPESESEAEEGPSGGETDVMSVLKERLKMYKAAEAKAKESGENSRARRFNRGSKTLEDLIKKAKGGKAVAPGDIPPVIAMNLKPPPPVQPVAAPEEEELVNGGEESEEAPSQPPEAPEGPVDVLSTLMERLKLYQTAEAKAKESGETMRAKRFNRGLKTIESLIRQAKAGKPVSPADIPPVVALNLKPAPPPQPEEPTDNTEEGEEDEMGTVDLASSPSEPKEEEPERNISEVLSERLGMYKTAEAKAKEEGEGTRARRFGRGIKTIESLIREVQAGKPVPLNDIPPPIALNLKPPPPIIEQPEDVPIESENLVRSPGPPGAAPLAFSAVEDVDLDAELMEEETPMTVLDGLEQRVRIYTRLKEKAEEEEDEISANQNERIIKIYMNAIRTYNKGGYVDVERLPTPKGAPPIPIPFQIP